MEKNFRRLFLIFILTIIKALSLFIFLVIILTSFGVIFVVCYFWRILLMCYVKMFKPKYSMIMQGKDPVLAIDDMYGRPLCTIVGMGCFDQRLDLASATKFVENSVNAKDEKGNFIHPKMHQYYEEWMGFIWWKWTEKFDINNHVRQWTNPNAVLKVSKDLEIVTENDLIRFISLLEQLPYRKKFSPWEVFIVSNVKLNHINELKTAVVFRFHHGLADGISMMQLLMKHIFEDTFDKIQKPKYISRSKFQKYFYQFRTMFEIPYQFFKQSFLAYDINPWHLSEDKLSRQIFKAWTNKIPLSWIQESKRENQVGFTAVLIAAISGSIRKIMLKNKVCLPKQIHAILPLPWPKHPQKLCNHWSYGFIGLPIGEDSRERRLLKCNKYVEKLKHSPSPAVHFFILSIFNLLPTWIIKKLTLSSYFPTIILSNFPGPPCGTEGIGGYPLVDACFTGGPLRGNTGISITILSYSEGLRIVIGVDSSILPSQELVNEFVEAIEHEFRDLRVNFSV